MARGGDLCRGPEVVGWPVRCRVRSPAVPRSPWPLVLAPVAGTSAIAVVVGPKVARLATPRATVVNKLLDLLD